MNFKRKRTVLLQNGDTVRNQVKHLFLILSFLLLSSPVIGDNHNGETLYRWDTSSGYVWKEFGEKDTNPKYKGDVENGKPNGLGVIINTNKGKYVGEWKDGKKHGQGTYTFLDDFGKYVGEFKNDKRHGQGTYYEGEGPFKGEWYEGEFKDGTLWNGTSYDKDGNITGKRVNGKHIEQ